MVEHDPEIIKTADWIIDMGPRLGKMVGMWFIPVNQAE